MFWPSTFRIRITKQKKKILSLQLTNKFPSVWLAWLFFQIQQHFRLILNISRVHSFLGFNVNRNIPEFSLCPTPLFYLFCCHLILWNWFFYQACKKKFGELWSNMESVFIKPYSLSWKGIWKQEGKFVVV